MSAPFIIFFRDFVDLYIDPHFIGSWWSVGVLVLDSRPRIRIWHHMLHQSCFLETVQFGRHSLYSFGIAMVPYV